MRCVMTTCMTCGTKDETTSYRPEHRLRLCAACNVDATRAAESIEDEPVPFYSGPLFTLSPRAMAVAR